MGGATGNLIDRVARGRVIDFIYFHHDAFSYPVFNLADSAITTGVAMILHLLACFWHDAEAADRAVAAGLTSARRCAKV